MKYKAPDPGNGWRLVEVGETLPHDCEFFDAGTPEYGWRESCLCGRQYDISARINGGFYRTRMPLNPPVAKPLGWKRIATRMSKALAPHDKQQAFLFGLIIGLCAAAFLVGCDSPTAPNPCRVHENQNDTVIVKDCGVKVGKLGQP